MATISPRRAKDGTVRYHAKVRLKGYTSQAATFDRKRDAERWAKETEVALRERRYFKATLTARHTVSDLIDRYLREVLPQKPGSHKQRAQFLWWKEKLGHALLADLTPSLLAEWRDRLAAGETPRGKPAAPATQVRYLAALGHALNVAVREWEWLDENPVRKVRRPSEPRGRVRFLSEEERTALLRECRLSRNPCLYPLVVLALATGARRGELLGLRWSDIDLERGVARLEHTKNGDRRALPLTGHVLSLLRELHSARRGDTSLVFPGREGKAAASPRNAFECACERAGVKDFRFHDLRHTAASYLAMNGATVAEIAGVLGHKTLAMVKRYTHLSDTHLSGVVARMNEAIFQET
jgi:integrase